MNLRKLTAMAAVLLSCFSFTAMGVTAEVPKTELRSAWLASILTNSSWPGKDTGVSDAVVAKQKASLINHIDRMVKYNCNALALQVRPMGDALYKSSCEPWSHYLTGTRGLAPSYDPLEFFIEECHSRGIEAHAWVNPFRLKKSTPMTDYDNQHVAKGWTLTYDGITIFDPGNPEVRKYIVDRVMEIVENYDIDGMMFDDYFYCPGLPTNITSGYDYAEYKASGTKLSLGDWRRENVNKMIAEVNAAIKAVKPWVRFGLSPRGIGGGPGGISAKKYGLPACPASAGDGMYNSIFCDPLAWMNEKTIDYISPQIYWPTTQSNAPYQPICNWWVKVSDRMDVAFYSSVGAYRNYGAGEMIQELNINRDENNDGDHGVVFYAAGDMDQYDSELKEAFPTKAVVPAMRNYNPASPGVIKSLTLKGNKLSCTPMENMRYIFYAVPKSVTRKNASNKVKSGLNAEYILNVSYTPEYTLPQDKVGGFWYAVAPYDRYGYEWEMTTYGETASKPGPVPVLVSPENGAKLSEGDLVMTVEKIAAANNQIAQVATDRSFNKIVASVTTPTSTTGDKLNFILPVSFFADGVYYWRSLATCDGLDEGISEVREFTINRNNGGDYSMITDGELYDFRDPAQSGRLLRLQNMWIRSDIHGNALNIGTEQCRDFAVLDNVIYIAHMDKMASTSAMRLKRYNAVTGEEMSTLELVPDENYTDFYAPLTNITLDSKNNLVIGSMALSNKNKLVIGKVDPVTGKVSTKGKMDVVKRIDHCDVVGDVDNDFYVIAASGATTDAYRWHVVNGEVKESKTYPLGLDPGTAPPVYRQSASEAFIDGSNMPFLHFTLGTGAPSSTFAEQKAVQVNGGAYFTFNGMRFLVYPHSNFPDGINYTIDYGKNLPYDYSNLTTLWQMTPKSFGSVTPVGGDYGALAKVVNSNDTHPAANIYLYVANNALAAYKLDYADASDVAEVVDGPAVRPTLQGGTLHLGLVADSVDVYNASGMMVANGTMTESVEVGGNSGLLIVKVVVDGESKAIKILL